MHKLHNVLYTVVQPSHVGNGRQHVTHRPRLVSPQCRSRVTGHSKYPNNCSFLLADCYVVRLPAPRVPLFATQASTAVDSFSFTKLRFCTQACTRCPAVLSGRSYPYFHTLFHITTRTRCNSAKPPESSWSALLVWARALNLSVCSSDSLNYPPSAPETS